MKMIIAVMSPTKVNTVREALVKIEVERMTVCDAQDFHADDDQDNTLFYRTLSLAQVHRRIVLEVVVNDDFLERTISAIRRAVEHGSSIRRNECDIYVLPMQQTIQIGPTTRGPYAV